MKKMIKIVSALISIVLLTACLAIGSSALNISPPIPAPVLVPEGYWYSYNSMITDDYHFSGWARVKVAQNVPVILVDYDLAATVGLTHDSEIGDAFEELRFANEYHLLSELAFSGEFLLPITKLEVVYEGFGYNVVTHTVERSYPSN